jgi:(E)-4-hydroxy-3-methylbut-2-enyl-diphosphate synthase
MDFLYCLSPFEYKRFRTREVQIGEVKMGGDNPIRVQSMTTTDTMDTKGTVEQSVRMIEAGCELVRITAPSIKEAENLREIKNELRKRGFSTPLVADIHFTPNAAEIAARIVEKVRINPGNYADKKKFDLIDYNDSQYNEELERIRKKFVPLIKICKEHGTAMRIGTNHGSLSDRIMSRYGDTPLGMVESALEFLRIAEEEKYHNLVLSMKASNPLVMVQAYRLLVKKMREENMAYPLHLGVTEAGEGEDGRIKSAVGIGTLLEDGLGDTIRVSLTEDPEFEIPVAKALADRYTLMHRQSRLDAPDTETMEAVEGCGFSPYEYSRKTTREHITIGAHQVPRVVADVSGKEIIKPSHLFAFGYGYSVPLDKWNISDQACDILYVGDKEIDFAIPGTLSVIQSFSAWKKNPEKIRHFPLLTHLEFIAQRNSLTSVFFLELDSNCFVETNAPILPSPEEKSILVLKANGMQDMRNMLFRLQKICPGTPVILKGSYPDASADQLQLWASTDLGGSILEGFGDGIWITSAPEMAPAMINSLSFGILQATRTRISKTEYISCPSCGRTLFDLQETTARIRKETDHLKGIKIGIMGCIVNGPGEMADADYGYVGSGPGKISLYKGKQVVRKGIDTPLAVEELIRLIKENGDWVEKPS